MVKNTAPSWLRAGGSGLSSTVGGSGGGVLGS